jgi:aromatic ring-opening dioxygenase catalytic subunit (LigB family)
MTMPTMFICHGAGPCFFMPWTRGPADTWDRMAAWLRQAVAALPERPKAVLIVSGHWEERVFTVGSSPAPPMYFDYYGFPEETYRLAFNAPGSPALAARVRALLGDAGIATGEDPVRGYDHGVFVPMLLMTPLADIPVVQLSLKVGLSPDEHLAAGRALAPLRDEGTLILGSGMTWHQRGFLPAFGPMSEGFDAWLETTMADPGPRDAAIRRWFEAPYAREAHPREEHLAPLFVAAGAAPNERGLQIFRDTPMGVTLSAYQFGSPA